MPIYEYQCEACGNRFEQIQKFADAPSDTCTVCGKGPIRRLLSSPAIQFKGAGWYVTDYAKKSGVPAGGKESTDSAKAGTGSTTTSESKSAATETPAAPATPKADAKKD
ncbi:MAG: zinc ribbon domain-containing protein [Vicinamibacterales bacterium]|nr:zinc ribbon domain-containing protein [Vicinamibacterales bacterium]